MPKRLTKRERAYKKRLEQILDAMDNLTEDQIRVVQRQLEKAYKDVASRVATTEWQAYRLPQLREAVKRIVEEFTQFYGVTLDDGLKEAFNLGVDRIDFPFAEAGIRVVAPEVSRQTLELAIMHTPDLIVDIRESTKLRINQKIISGITGQRTQFQVMKEIEAVLLGTGEKAPDGVSTAYRAERISRTELARVNNNAAASRMKQIERTEPETQRTKVWMHSGKKRGSRRRYHFELDEVEIPIDEKFNSKYAQLEYPHAPGGPAREVINCGCTFRIETDWDKLADEFLPVGYEPRSEILKKTNTRAA
jgi:hypothetical protein